MSVKQNLIVCRTPLQSLIISKIINFYPNEDFHLIYLTLEDNKKYRYYYNLLKDKVKTSHYIFLKQYLGLSMLIHLTLLKLLYNKYFKHIRFDKLLFSSIDSDYVHLIEKLANYNKLETFDDGTANIFTSGVYFIEKKKSLKSKFIRRMFSLKKNIHDIKREIIIHNSIYKNSPFMEKARTRQIDLFVFSDSQNSNKIIKVFLGQPINDLGAGINYHYLDKILKKYEINMYYPHPRERINDSDITIEIVDSLFIFEDYIQNLQLENPNTKFEIYGFLSTVLFNVKGVDRYSFRSASLKNRYSKLYDLIEDFDIKIIDLDE